MIMMCIVAIQGQQNDSNQNGTIEKLNINKIQEKLVKTELFSNLKIKYYNIKLSQLINFIGTFDPETAKKAIDSVAQAVNFVAQDRMIFVALCKENTVADFYQFYINFMKEKDKNQPALKSCETKEINENQILFIKTYEIKEKKYTIYDFLAKQDNKFIETIVTTGEYADSAFEELVQELFSTK